MAPILNPRELPKDRLTTTDSDGNRSYIYSAEVKGKWHSRRAWIQTGLLVFFLVMPWIRIAGKPAILLDVVHRRFSILGMEFWAHDAPMVLFVLGGFVFSLVFVTSVWGRAWCGWACPQTVFIERIYRKIETWIEGDSVKRKQRDQAPLSADLVWRKGAKWTAFTLVSLGVTHSFLAYFVGTERVLEMMQHSPSANLTSFLVILVTTGIILFDFGWFREQFCVIACPYGRFQSVLMDQRSMLVGYDAKRGEPRGKAAPGGAPAGDCVDCYRCVQVCPTGIDIRRGLQLECIACTACIDACDDVMTRLKRPTGLIRYSTQTELTEGPGEKTGVSALRPRSLFYGAILAILAVGFAILVTHRVDLDQTWVRAVGTPYDVIQNASGTTVVNRYRVDLTNQVMVPLTVRIFSPEKSGVQVVSAYNPLTLEPGTSRRLELFLQIAPAALNHGSGVVDLQVETSRPDRAPAFTVQKVRLVGPLQ